VRTVVEMGAGTGALLAALAERLPAAVSLVGVERRPRPPGLPPSVRWRETLPAEVDGLLLAVEWLDTVPADVVVDGRVVLVDDDGTESAGLAPDAADAAWLARWWPQGARREVGRRRDEAWADAVRRVRQGAALAVDYGYRCSDPPTAGTLRAYRDGREVSLRPRPDRDVTAAVAWDSVVDAADRAAGQGGRATVLTSQRAALRELGLSAALPARGTPGYAEALRRTGRVRALLDPAGLGAFGWCLTGVGSAPERLLGRSGSALPEQAQ
jgi:SAM-dependent MidA family methyltransferase